MSIDPFRLSFQVKGLKLPCCAWALSPKTILRAMSEGETVRNAQRDAWLSVFFLRETWCNLVVGNYKDWRHSDELKGEDEREDSTHSTFSPLNGRMKGLCPIYLSCGATELVLDDTLLFAEKAFAAGVEVKVEIEPFLCHPYPIFAEIFPEAADAVVRGAMFINEKLNKARLYR